MDHESRNGLPANEKVDSRIAYDGRATRERIINHLLGSSKRGHQCRPDDEKGREANTYLFRQSSTARSRNQLHSNGKASTRSMEHPEDNSKDMLIEDAEELPDPWTLFTDGSTYADGSRAGLILTNPEGTEFTYALRNENKKADALRKIASTSFAHLSKQVMVEELKEKSISAAEVLAVVEEEEDTWMTPIFKYLTDGTLPAEGKKARVVKRKSWRMHAGTRSVVAKALRIGYYWPTMHEDARKLIQACQDCQVHKPVPRNPQQKLSPITSPWPFYKRGIDIAGPFPEGLGKIRIPPPDGRRHPLRMPQARQHSCTTPGPAVPTEHPFL
ncbi:reverse transcriptase domain-containing protein, partial [Tanacetum coccineum]